MIEEYLNRLKRALIKKGIPEADDIVQYFDEIIEDRIEQGEDLEEVLRDLGEPEQIVKAFGGNEETDKKEKHTDETDHTRSVYYGIRTIKITNTSYDFEILRSPDETTVFECESDDDTMMHEQVGDTLNIEQDFPFYGQGVNILQKMFHGSFNGGDVTLYVPDGCTMLMDNVSGDIEVQGLRLDQLNIDSVSGDLELEDVAAQNMKINTVSGDIEMDDIVVEETMKIDAVNGDYDGDRISCKNIIMNSVNGDIDIGLNARRDQVDVKATSLFHEKTSGGGHCDHKLRIDTVNGDISYHFLTD